jgi:HlyD family secretion protein
MKRMAQWSLVFIMIALAAFGATLLAARGAQMALLLAGDAGVDAELPAGSSDSVGTLAADQAPETAAEEQTLPGQELSAVGAIEVTDDRQVVLGTGGRVDQVLVEVGDRVQAGDLLIALDTTYLDWAVEQAEIGFEAARIDFEELGDLIEESDIEVAKAQLLQAQEDLAEVKAGPTAEELAAAESAAAAAWAQYEEIQKEPTPAQVNQALANLRKAEITLQQAQREFDKIAWLPESAATEAADDLQRATVDMEAAKAAYEEASKPATEAELQSALSAAQSAQDRLNRLLDKPTPADLAAANANVLAAQTALAKLEEGPKESELRKAELNVRQAMIALEQARLQRKHAEVQAPMDGVLLSVNLDIGQEASPGTVAATLADTANLRLVVNVEQKDIGKVKTGQPVAVSVFALPEEQFAGVVDRISPIANSGTGFVTFPVVIVLTDGPLEQLLPGMTASAVFGAVDAPAQEAETDSPESAVNDTQDAEPEDVQDEEPDSDASSESGG